MKGKEMLLEWYSWLLRSLHIKKINNLSLFQNEEILSSRKVRGSTPRLSTHTHARTFSFLFFSCFVKRVKRLRETTPFFFLHFFSIFSPKSPQKKMSVLLKP